MHQHRFRAAALAAVLLGSMALAGCDGPKDHVNESYQGVPTNGQSCKEFYQLPANQVKCTNQDGRGGK